MSSPSYPSSPLASSPPLKKRTTEYIEKKRIFGEAKREFEECVEELFERLQQRGVSGMQIGVKVKFGDDELFSFEIQREVSEEEISLSENVLANKQPSSLTSSSGFCPCLVLSSSSSLSRATERVMERVRMERGRGLAWGDQEGDGKGGIEFVENFPRRNLIYFLPIMHLLFSPSPTKYWQPHLSLLVPPYLLPPLIPLHHFILPPLLPLLIPNLFPPLLIPPLLLPHPVPHPPHPLPPLLIPQHLLPPLLIPPPPLLVPPLHLPPLVPLQNVSVL